MQWKEPDAKTLKADGVSLAVGAFSELYETELLTRDYAIALINMTRDSCMDIAATRFPGEGDDAWKWTPIPRTCPNCRNGYQYCCNNGRYNIIMTTPCNASPFELFVGKLNGTQALGAVFYITPNCDYSGGCIGIDD